MFLCFGYDCAELGFYQRTALHVSFSARVASCVASCVARCVASCVASCVYTFCCIWCCVASCVASCVALCVASDVARCVARVLHLALHLVLHADWDRDMLVCNAGKYTARVSVTIKLEHEIAEDLFLSLPPLVDTWLPPPSSLIASRDMGNHRAQSQGNTRSHSPPLAHVRTHSLTLSQAHTCVHSLTLAHADLHLLTLSHTLSNLQTLATLAQAR